MSEEPTTAVRQNIDIGHDVVGSAITSGSHNVVHIKYVNFDLETVRELMARPAPPAARGVTPGPNPYLGLSAFQEADAGRFFGRARLTQRLWDKLRDLQTAAPGRPRLRWLSILGPSGSGKSSLARAGLIAELARRPLPAMHDAQVAVLTPGAHPLESLAKVLARMATGDPAPVAKTREFHQELAWKNATGQSDGLRRIAESLPAIETAPLVLLIDQFEELYALCPDQNERLAVIDNLLAAARDPGGRVTVVMTFRTDFVGATQRHEALNALICDESQTVMVPAMSTEELREAIAKPAELAGHPLDAATIALLIGDTQDREGALPLLQFALARIWEGLLAGAAPAVTYQQIGGVGGALAGEAQRIYDHLGEEDRRIARRVFLGLVQLGEGVRDTRRRVDLEDLVAFGDEPDHVREVIGRFAHREARLITLAMDEPAHDTTAEVTHEALFSHWAQLHQWLEESREDVRFHRRLDDAAHRWDGQQRPEGSLWRPPDLDLLRQYHQRAGRDMTPLQLDFFVASHQAERRRLEAEQRYAAEREARLARIRRQRRWLLVAFSVASVLASLAAVSAVVAWRSSGAAERARREEQEARELAEVSFHDAQAAVDDFFTKVSEEYLLDQPGMQALQQDLLILARDYYERFLRQRGDDPDLRHEAVRSRFRLGVITEKLRGSNEALPLYEQAIETLGENAVDLAWDELLDLSSLYNAKGRVLHHRARLAEARDCYQRALALRRQLVDQNPGNEELALKLASSYMNLGLVANDERNFDGALSPMHAAQEIRRKCLAADGTHRLARRDLAMGYYNMALVAQRSEDAETSAKHVSAAIEQFRLALDGQPNDLELRHRLATALRLRGDVDGAQQSALEHYRQAAGELRSLVELKPKVISYRVEYARLQMNTGYKLLARELTKLKGSPPGQPAALDLAEAVAVLQTAARGWDGVVRDAPEDRDCQDHRAKTLMLLGEAQYQARHFAAAQQTFQAARDQYDALLRSAANPEHQRQRKYAEARCQQARGQASGG